MQARTAVEFTLQPPGGGSDLNVTMYAVGERWVARVAGRVDGTAVALSARGALTAALAPLGERAVTLLLADLRLLEPSCQVISIERAHSA